MIEIEGVKILSDKDVRSQLKMSDAVGIIESTFKEIDRGMFVSPARHNVENENGSLVFTVGGNLRDGAFGFRVYETFSSEIEHKQIVNIYDAKTGRLKGLIFGEVLGAYRTGAIGGVAIKYLSKKSAHSVGLIGSGLQAETQLMAACAVRNISKVKVFSRNESSRVHFALEMKQKLDIEIVAVDSPKIALQNVDIAILATNSGVPVIEPEWIPEGCYLSSIGPKFMGRNELGASAVKGFNSIFTDSLEQMKNYPKAHFLSGTPEFEQIQSLGDVVTGRNVIISDSNLFLSVGLSGTEPAIGNLLL